MKNELMAFLKAEDAVSTIEIVLIAVVLVGLVVAFKEPITRTVESILTKVDNNANGV